MTITTAIKGLMKKQHITQTQFAEILGLGNQNSVSSRLKRGNTTVATALDMLSPLGYVLVLQPEDMPVQDGATLITQTDEDVALTEEEKLIRRYRKQLDTEKREQFDALAPDAQLAIARFSA